MQDKLLNLDQYTELEDFSVFSLEHTTTLPTTLKKNEQLIIMIEMGSNMLEISRDIYTFLDLLSDIGGIQGIFISFGAFFFAYWEQN